MIYIDGFQSVPVSRFVVVKEKFMSVLLIYSHLTAILGPILAISMLTKVNREQRSPSGTIAWLLVIMTMPLVGIPLYLMLGGRKMRRDADRKADLKLLASQAELPATLNVTDSVFRNLGLPGISAGNRIRLCPTGEACFHDLMALIDTADERIHITTFILSPDEVGREIVARLAARAEEGVKVRLNLDAIGSMRAGGHFLRPLLKAGGEVAYFMPILRKNPFRGRANLRNHRKLVVVDGKRVMAGGTNMASEYIGPTPKPGRWRDLSFILEGPAAHDYEEVFRADWEFAHGTRLELPEADFGPVSEQDPGALVQVVPSGPDIDGDYLYDFILTAIFSAQKRFWIVTPYFVPDETLAKALQIAAHRGVDVCIRVPQRSNHRLTDVAGRQFLREIQAAGGRIFYYTGGMMHAKIMIVDNRIAAIGSANMDLRSLHFNYEIMMLTFSRPEIDATVKWIEDLEVVPRPAEEKESRLRDFGEGLVRIVAPLL